MMGNLTLCLILCSCNQYCKVESGWNCGTGTCISDSCGDGFRVQNEECDDGNAVPDDGCTACIVDPEYRCVGGSSTSKDVCSPTQEGQVFTASLADCN